MEQINIKTAALRRAITQSINQAALPPCVVGLVLDKLRGEVTALEAQAMAREQQEQKQQEQQAQAEEA